jgi:hypothetical protein
MSGQTKTRDRGAWASASRAAFLASTFSLVLATNGDAQNARVVSCNSSNGQILEIDFSGLTSTLLTSDSNRVSMQSCVFRNDGAAGLHLIVADRNGELVFFANGMGIGQIILGNDPANPAHPNGLSLDPAHNVYGVTSSTGSSTASDAHVWMLLRDASGSLPGGYEGPVGYIDTAAAGVEELDETILVTSNFVVGDPPMTTLADGDLLVLASDPPMVLRYHAVDLAAFRTALATGGLPPAELTPEVFIHPPGAAVPLANQFPSGHTPRGMDLTQDGRLLISASEGVILQYGADGTRLTDFVTGLGNGQFKLATGRQDGALRVFLTDRNRGEVHRFGFAGDGTGILEASVADPESPNGIATTTAAIEVTPTGSGVTVGATNLMMSLLEFVEIPGATGIMEVVFPDPRALEVGAPADPSAPLHRALDLNAEISSLLPAGVVIPAHIRGFRTALAGDPPGAPSGPPTILFLVADSSAGILGTIQHVADEALVLGYSPSCADPDPAMRPKMFWRDNPATGEPPIPENTFINVTNDCGTSHGLTKRYSLFIPGARDTRPPTEVFEAQFAGLGTVLTNATCIRTKTHKTLERHYETARRQYFDRGRPDKALTALQTLLAVAEASTEDFVNCNENEGGGVRARVAAAIFSLLNL